MKKFFLISILLGALPFSMMAQDDDLYFVPKKKSTTQKAETQKAQKDTYYVGSSRSVDEYNRRGSSYEVIGNDSVSDIIDFNAVQGVYPDSVVSEDYALTKKMARFDEYNISDNAAFWAGYNAGRSDWDWHSPFYYGRMGWYDPWFYGSYNYGWYNPWYWDWAYWYNPLWSYYGWGYPYHYGWYGWYDPWYYGGGVSGRHYAYRNGNTGTINRYSSERGGYRGSTSLGGSRSSSLRSRTISGHTAYGNAGTRSSNNNSSYQRSASSRSNNASFGGSRSSSSSGSFGGGGGSTRSSGGGFSGGGGGRSGGSSMGGRR